MHSYIGRYACFRAQSVRKTVRCTVPANTGIFVGSIDTKPEAQSIKPLIAVDSNATYLPTSASGPGKLLYVRGGMLMAQPFDAGNFQLLGDAVPVAQRLGSLGGRFYYFTASATGLIAYRGGGTGEQLAWLDRKGRILGTIGDVSLIGWPSISPDGSMIAVDRMDVQGTSMDLHDLTRGTALRLTSGGIANRFPVWSPDGSHIAFASNRNGNLEVFQRSTHGSGQDERLDADPRPKYPFDWSPDGRYILEVIIDPRAHADIWLIPTFGDRKPFPYLQTEFNEMHPRLSPTGQWVAYESDITGRSEIYVQAFPKAEAKWPISSGGGSLPIWSRDGRELYFIAPDREMMAVEVHASADQKFEPGVAKPLHRLKEPGGFRQQ